MFNHCVNDGAAPKGNTSPLRQAVLPAELGRLLRRSVERLRRDANKVNNGEGEGRSSFHTPHSVVFSPAEGKWVRYPTLQYTSVETKG